MSVQEYFFKLCKLSMYAPSLVYDSRDEMRHFLKGVSDDIMEENRATILHDNLEILILLCMYNSLRILGLGSVIGCKHAKIL